MSEPKRRAKKPIAKKPAGERRPADVVDQRIREIAAIMATGQWTTAHCMALAKKWGANENTVRDWIRIARRVVWHEDDREHIDELKVATILKLERIAEDALSGMPPNYNAAIQALALLANVSGMTKPAQQVVNVRMLVMPFLETFGRWAAANMTPEQLASWEAARAPLLKSPEGPAPE